jgi:hypothetical protein
MPRDTWPAPPVDTDRNSNGAVGPVMTQWRRQRESFDEAKHVRESLEEYTDSTE